MARFGPRRTWVGGGLFVWCLLWAGCASGSSGNDILNSDPNLITREQILAIPDGSALEVVQRYRSSWLRPRSQGTVAGARRNPQSGTVVGDPDMPIVFVDDTPIGGVGALAQISATNAESIVFISALDATTRYGTGYAGGIIRVNTVNAR